MRSRAVGTAPDGSKTVTEKVITTVTRRTTYPQNWPAYNAAQTQEKAAHQQLKEQMRGQ